MEEPHDASRLDRIEAVLERLTGRLDRLTERHEALTMNLELSARDIENLKILALRDGEHIRQLAQNSLILHESIKSLENIAAAHGERLDGLEGR
jgi:chromosome segregation ATPase